MKTNRKRVTSRLTVRDLLTPGRTSSNMINFIMTKQGELQARLLEVEQKAARKEKKRKFALVNDVTTAAAHWIKKSGKIVDDFKVLKKELRRRGVTLPRPAS